MSTFTPDHRDWLYSLTNKVVMYRILFNGYKDYMERELIKKNNPDIDLCMGTLMREMKELKASILRVIPLEDIERYVLNTGHLYSEDTIEFLKSDLNGLRNENWTIPVRSFTTPFYSQSIGPMGRVYSHINQMRHNR